jgi:hypothetical protein
MPSAGRDTGSGGETASKQQIRAFSSEVETGSRQENASNQESGGSVLVLIGTDIPEGRAESGNVRSQQARNP